MLQYLRIKHQLKVMAIVVLSSITARAETLSPEDGSLLLLGSGYNSLTGETRGRCVEISEILRADMPSDAFRAEPGAAPHCMPSGQCVDFSITHITNSNDLRRVLDIHAKTSVGFGAFSAHAKAKFYEQNRLTSNTTYIVLKVEVKNASESLKEYNLAGWARDLLLKGDRATFLNRCGDSFVAGRTSGGEFIAVIKISSSSERSLNDIQAKLAISGVVWSANASMVSTLKEISKENHVEITMFKKGSIGSLPDHTDIEKVFQFARELPIAVQSNSSPSFNLFSTIDYDVVSNLPAEIGSLSIHKKALEIIASTREAALKRFSDADSVLKYPKKYFPFDETAVTDYRRELGKLIDQLDDLARTCLNNPLNFDLPKLDVPRFNLPNKHPFFPLKKNDSRLIQAPEFKRLGKMFEAVGLIWSGVGRDMPYSDAVAFCRNLDLSRGGGARLPTLEEYEDLARAMRSIVPGGYYIPEVIPDMKEHEFWTSTIQKNIYSTEKIRSFSGELGEVNIWTSLGMSLKSAFRCVRDA